MPLNFGSLTPKSWNNVHAFVSNDCARACGISLRHTMAWFKIGSQSAMQGLKMAKGPHSKLAILETVECYPKTAFLEPCPHDQWQKQARPSDRGIPRGTAP